MKEEMKNPNIHINANANMNQNRHDWVQMEEETTQPLRRALYTPKLQGHVEL